MYLNMFYCVVVFFAWLLLSMYERRRLVRRERLVSGEMAQASYIRGYERGRDSGAEMVGMAKATMNGLREEVEALKGSLATAESDLAAQGGERDALAAELDGCRVQLGIARQTARDGRKRVWQRIRDIGQEAIDDIERGDTREDVEKKLSDVLASHAVVSLPPGIISWPYPSEAPQSPKEAPKATKPPKVVAPRMPVPAEPPAGMTADDMVPAWSLPVFAPPTVADAVTDYPDHIDSHDGEVTGEA